jgi:hypothetical protein
MVLSRIDQAGWSWKFAAWVLAGSNRRLQALVELVSPRFVSSHNA